VDDIKKWDVNKFIELLIPRRDWLLNWFEFICIYSSILFWKKYEIIFVAFKLILWSETTFLRRFFDTQNRVSWRLQRIALDIYQQVQVLLVWLFIHFIHSCNHLLH